MPRARAADWATAPQLAIDVIQLQQQATANTNSILQTLQQMEADLIDALRLHSGQATSNATAQTQAAAQMADLRDAREVQGRTEGVRAQAIVNATSGPSTCNVVTGTIAGRSTGTNMHDYQRALQAAFSGYDGGETGAGMSGGRQGAMDHRQATHCSAWATRGEVTAGACTTVGSNPGADLRADTILGAPQNVLSQDDEDAAVAFGVTAGVPIPLGSMPGGLSTDQMRQTIVARNSSLAVNSVATAILGDMIAIRKPWQTANGAPDGLATWAQGTAATMPEYSQSAANASNIFPNGVSRLAWMRLSAYRWIGNPNMLVGISDPVAAAKTSTEILANMTAQNFEQFAQSEKTNMLLSMILALMEQDHRRNIGLASR